MTSRMKTAKIAPGSSPTTREDSGISRKLEPTKGEQKSTRSRYVVLAITGIVVAVGAAFLISLQKPQNSFDIVPGPKTSQRPATEDVATPYWGNAEEHGLDYGCVIGIEFGETYSRVGASHHSGLDIFIVDGQLQIPNYVAYTDDGILVGQKAQDQALTNPTNTIFDVRRLMGRRLSSGSSLQGEIETLPYTVVFQKDKPVIKVSVNGSDMFITPEEVQAEILKEMKTAAEAFYGQEVTNTIMTVPAKFNDDQRQATKDAALMAGLNVLRLVNEPTAAAIAHKIDLLECPESDCEVYILAYNLGEKHVDVTVSSIDQGVFEIMGTSSDWSIGGRDFDSALLDHVVGEFLNSEDVEVKATPALINSLRAQVAKAEKTLLTKQTFKFRFGKKSLSVTRDQYQAFHRSLFSQSVNEIEAVLREAELRKSNISHLVVTGNVSQVSKMQPFLEDYVSGKKSHSVVSSDKAILRGAVYQAEILSGNSDMDWVGAFDVVVLSLGIETTGGLYTSVIPRYSTLPTRRSINITTINDNQSKLVINIFEGERPFVANNRLYATFNVTGLSPKSAGAITVQLDFEMDMNSVLRVTAKEIGSSQETVFQIPQQVEAQLTTEEIDNIFAEAEAHAEKDYKRRSAVDESPLEDYGDGFGVAIIPREGEFPLRWCWDEKENKAYKIKGQCTGAN